MTAPRILSPLDGDCLNPADGREAGGELLVPVWAEAPEDAELWIGDVRARKQDGRFTAEVGIPWGRSVLSALDRRTGLRASAEVFRLRNAWNRYCLTADDNILFLQELSAHPEAYPSAFDHPYLALFREAHERYGAAVRMNLFWEFDRRAAAGFSAPRPDFNLAGMTDRFREEFRANASWLTFAFHANAEFPDRPYRGAGAGRLAADAARVNREIVRFAGPEALSPFCTLHWGDTTAAGADALRAAGYRGLSGLFEFGPDGAPHVAYHHPPELVRRIGGRDFWYDRGADLLYGRLDIVLNHYRPETLRPALEAVARAPGRFGFFGMLIHEQYFYPDYRAYLPGFRRLVLDACAFAREAGRCGAPMGAVLPSLTES